MIEHVQNGKLRQIGLDRGFMTEQDLEEIAKAWEEWVGREDGVLGMMQGEVLIEK